MMNKLWNNSVVFFCVSIWKYIKELILNTPPLLHASD